MDDEHRRRAIETEREQRQSVNGASRYSSTTPTSAAAAIDSLSLSLSLPIICSLLGLGFARKPRIRILFSKMFESGTRTGLLCSCAVDIPLLLWIAGYGEMGVKTRLRLSSGGMLTNS